MRLSLKGINPFFIDRYKLIKKYKLNKRLKIDRFYYRIYNEEMTGGKV